MRRLASVNRSGPTTSPRSGCDGPRHTPVFGKRASAGGYPGLPLGDVVHVVLGVVVDLIEQLTQGNELRPVDVPVGLLGLRFHVLAVAQPGIEPCYGRMSQGAIRFRISSLTIRV